LVGVIVGVVVWLGIRGDIPFFLQQVRTLTASVRAPVAMELTPEFPIDTTVPTDEVSEATESPEPETPSTAALTPEATPVSGAVDATPTPTLSGSASSNGGPPVCIPRTRFELLRQEPDGMVLPDAAVAVYLSARNAGNCTWPDDMRVAFVSGAQMGAPDAIPLHPLAAGASMQVIVPLRAPLEPGVYTSTWTLNQSAGGLQAAAIPIVVEVAVPPTPTPTPRVTQPQPTSTATPALPPLLLAPPTLATWGEDAVSGMWYGVLTLQAEGGVGDYRYYRGEIRSDTLLAEGQLPFSWRRCEALPLTVWVVSGADVVRWEGWIDYPAAQNCR